MKIQFVQLVMVSAVILSCQTTSKKTLSQVANRDTTISVANSYSELFFDSLQLENFIANEKLHDSLAMAIRSFYNQRNYQYAWFFKQGMADYATTFLNQQNDYMNYSGDSSIYNIVLQSSLDSLNDTTSYNPPDSLKLKTEFLLTRQFFRYASRAYAGRRDINTKDLGWYIPRKKVDFVSLLDSLLVNKGKNLSQYEPVNRQYNLLKDYLLKYYEAEKKGVWTAIVADKKSYKPGDASPAVIQIKRRLFLTGDLTTNDTSDLFTDSLATAIKRYQHRNGLTEDGKAGPSLLNEMNRPIGDRIRQILKTTFRRRQR